MQTALCLLQYVMANGNYSVGYNKTGQITSAYSRLSYRKV